MTANSVVGSLNADPKGVQYWTFWTHTAIVLFSTTYVSCQEKFHR